MLLRGLACSQAQNVHPRKKNPTTKKWLLIVKHQIVNGPLWGSLVWINFSDSIVWCLLGTLKRKILFQMGPKCMPNTLALS